MNTRGNEPNKMAEAIGGQRPIHKVFFEVRRSSFHGHSEGGNNNKKQNETSGKSNLKLSFLLRLFMGVRKGGSIEGSVDKVLWGVHGPGGQCFRVTQNKPRVT